MDYDIDNITGLIDRPPPEPHPFGPRSVAAILDATIRAQPDRLALIENEREWTYAELDTAVEGATGALASLGVGPADRVVWSLPNCAEIVVGFLATARRGAVWVGLHPRLTGTEKSALVAHCEPTLVVDDLVAWRSKANDGTATSTIGIDPHQPAAFAYTSGTTGAPKAAVHSQHNLLWPGLVSVEMDPPGPADRTGTPFALTSLNLMVLGPLTAFARGGAAVVLHHTDAAGFAVEVSRTRLTRAVLVPTMLHDLVTEGVEPSLLDSVRTVLVGGAGTPPTTRDAFTRRFAIVPVLSYGLSEAPTGVARTGPDPSIGATPLPLVEVEIRDSAGNAVSAGTEGEICLKPSSKGRWAGCWSPTLGYWRAAESTRTLLRGDALHTGDIGALDELGRLRVEGRAGDVIVRGGANIYPVEIERVLLEHYDVDTAAVTGLADPRLGERVVAFVTTRQESLDTAELATHCRALLAPFKVPELIQVVDELPVNRAGKIQRKALAALLNEPPDKAEQLPS